MQVGFKLPFASLDADTLQPSPQASEREAKAAEYVAGSTQTPHARQSLACHQHTNYPAPGAPAGHPPPTAYSHPHTSSPAPGAPAGHPPRTAYPHPIAIAIPTPKTSGARVQQNMAQWNLTINSMMNEPSSDRNELQRVRSALGSGVLLDLTGKPELVRLPNTPAVRRNPTLCKERVAYYMDIGALEALSEKPELLQPLHVVERPGRKARMVLDLSRNLNDLIEYEAFHMQSIRSLVKLSSPGSYYGKMDLSDCFLSFPVHPDSRQYLAFELEGDHYQFKRLPFGLCSSPIWTERFLSCIDFALRKAGVTHVRYCDDFCFMASSPVELTAMMNTARSIFASHGLVENPDKTEGPAQSITFLGLGIDSISQRLYVPSDKVEELLQLSGDMASRDTTRLRHLQSLVGKFSFVASVLPGARPFFRRLIDATRDKRGGGQYRSRMTCKRIYAHGRCSSSNGMAKNGG